MRARHPPRLTQRSGVSCGLPVRAASSLIPPMAAAGLAVSVTFLGALGRLAGRREATVAVETSATVGDLLASLAATYGPDFAGALFRVPGEAHTHLRVFLDEQEAALTDRIASAGEAARVAVLVVPGFEGGSG